MTQRGSAREEILGRIADHLRGMEASSPTLPHEVPSPIAESIAEERSALVTRFRERLLEVGGALHAVPDWDAAAAAIEELIAAKDATRIALSDHPELNRRLTPVLAGTEVLRAPAAKAPLLDCQLGISTAQWAIADTGTLILESAAEAHRLVSLVPPIHVAVVEARQILPGIAEALARIAPRGSDAMSPCVTFITGPSRTADIELTLVVGVHGPQELHCILIAGD